MYGSYQRHLAESAAAEQERKRVERRRVEHAAHAVAVGIACEQTHLVGASWATGWSCPTCGYAPIGRN